MTGFARVAPSNRKVAITAPIAWPTPYNVTITRYTAATVTVTKSSLREQRPQSERLWCKRPAHGLHGKCKSRDQANVGANREYPACQCPDSRLPPQCVHEIIAAVCSNDETGSANRHGNSHGLSRIIDELQVAHVRLGSFRRGSGIGHRFMCHRSLRLETAFV